MTVKRARMVEMARREDDAEAELTRLHREKRRMELRAARLLARIDSSAHFVHRGCASLAEYGERNGMSGREARVLAAVGKALALQPALEELVLAGRVSLDAAAALAKVFANPDLVRDGDDWLVWAEDWTAKELERKVREREVEAKSGEPSSAMTVVMTASGRVKFERARVIACRKEKRLLSEGEAVELLSEHYLDSFDAGRRQPRRRRMPSTEGQPGRHVPAEVVRALLARQGDRCAVPTCDHRIWLEKAHLHAHRLGGSRELWNLIYLCWQHHMLVDAGLLIVSGTADQPVFRTGQDALVRERAPPYPAGAA